jgi:hypothetical protein
MEKLAEGRTVLPRPTLRNLYDRVTSKFLVMPENIGYAVYPLVEFIHEERPDYILAFDRGARITALATAMLHRELYGDLPTRDHKINLRKVSVNVDRDILRVQLQSDVGQMLASTESPKVLLLDDWIHGGQTKALATDLITEFSGGKADIHYGVMIGNGTGKGLGKGKGEGADVWGVGSNFGYYSWRNKTHLIGIDYNDDLQPHSTLSPQAVIFRNKVARNIRRFAGQVKASDTQRAA